TPPGRQHRDRGLWHELRQGHRAAEARGTGACGMTPEGIMVPVGTGADVVPSPSLDQAREFIRASKAENTLRGYQSDWREFCAWCEGHGVGPLPASPENVAAYIAECAGHLKPGSIQRRLNAIAEAHKAAVGESRPAALCASAAGMVKN